MFSLVIVQVKNRLCEGAFTLPFHTPDHKTWICWPVTCICKSSKRTILFNENYAGPPMKGGPTYLPHGMYGPPIPPPPKAKGVIEEVKPHKTNSPLEKKPLSKGNQ